MNTNLRIIQEYYSKIQLKYKEEIINIKRNNKNDNHHIMFKDQFPEFNNLMLEFLNIVPSYYNILKLKSLKNQIINKLIDSEEIIQTLTELKINISNEINILKNEIIKYVDNQENLSIDSLKYIHNKLLSEDLSPLSSLNKNNLLNNIINDINNLTKDIEIYNLNNNTIPNNTGIEDEIGENIFKNGETAEKSVNDIIQLDEKLIFKYKNIPIYKYYNDYDGKSKVYDDQNNEIYLSEYIGKSLNNLNFDASITRKIVDIINYLGWKYEIGSYNRYKTYNDKFIVIYTTDNVNYNVNCKTIIEIDEEDNEINNCIKNENTGVLIRVIDNRNDSSSDYSFNTVPIFPKDVYYNNDSVNNLHNNISYVVENIINKGIDIERLRYYYNLSSSLKDIANIITRNIIVNAFYNYNIVDYINNALVSDTLKRLGITCRYYQHIGHIGNDDQLLVEFPVDNIEIKYTMNEGSTEYNPVDDLIRVNENRNYCYIGACGSSSLLQGVDLKSTLISSILCDDLGDNTIGLLTSVPFKYSIIKFDLDNNIKVDDVDKNVEDIYKDLEDILNPDKPTNPENPDSGETNPDKPTNIIAVPSYDSQIPVEIDIEKYYPKIPDSINNNSPGTLPEYYKNIKSELYHYYYNKEAKYNDYFDLVYCNKHKIDNYQLNSISLSHCNINNNQISRGVYNKLLNDNKYYNNFNSDNYIIGEEMDNKTLLNKIKVIKNNYSTNNNYDEKLLLKSFEDEVLNIYQSLPSGYNIYVEECYGISNLNNYFTPFVINKLIDDKYFDGKITYFVNAVYHILNPGKVRINDNIISKYDLSLFTKLNSEDDNKEIYKNKIILLELLYIKNQFDNWYGSIKNKLGFIDNKYYANLDIIRKLAKDNNELNEYSNMMDINYERTLKMNNYNKYDFKLPLTKTYNIFEVIKDICINWINLIVDNSGDTYNDINDIQRNNQFEDNEYINYFKYSILNIFNDDKYYYSILQTLDNIIPNNISNVITKNNINKLINKQNICYKCYDNFIKFSVERFYNVVEKINLMKKYYDTLGCIIDYYNDYYIINDDIMYIDNISDFEEDISSKYVYMLKDNNNKLCEITLNKGSVVFSSGKILNISKPGNCVIDMLYTNIITKGSKIKSKFIDNLIIFKPKTLKHFLKKYFIGKTLIKLNKDKVNISENTYTYKYNQLEFFKILFKENEYKLYKTTINKTNYEISLNKFSDNNEYTEIDIPENDNNYYTIIDDIYLTKTKPGHYLITKDNNYQYLINKNNNYISALINKIGLGPYVIMVKDNNSISKVGISNCLYMKNKDDIYNYIFSINDFSDNGKFYEVDNYYIISNIKPFIVQNELIGESLNEDIEIYDWEKRLCGVNYISMENNEYISENNDQLIQKFKTEFTIKEFNELMLRKCFPDKFKSMYIINKEVIENIDSEKYFISKSQVEDALYNYGKYPKYLEHYFMNHNVDYKLKGIFNIRCIINPNNLLSVINNYFNIEEFKYVYYEAIVQGKDMIINNGQIISAKGDIYLVGIEINNNKIINIKPVIIKNKGFVNVIDFQQFNDCYGYVKLYVDKYKIKNPHIIKLSHLTYNSLKNCKYITYN